MDPSSRLDRYLPFRGERRAIRRWRRTRPFWGGLYLMAGGLEILLVPLSPLPVMVSLGIAGIASLAIGVILMVAGLFLWFSPQHRHFVGIIAMVSSIASFVAANLGGFLLGMLLGVVGSSMGFAWRPKPVRRTTVEPAAASVAASVADDPGEPTDRGYPSEPVPATVDDAADTGTTPPASPAPLVNGRAHVWRRGGGSPSVLSAVLPILIVVSVLGSGGDRAEAVATAAETCPDRGTTAACGSTRAAAAAAPTAADGVVVGAKPPAITASYFAPNGFALAGVTTIRTGNGPLRVLKLTMQSAHLRDYRLSTQDDNGPGMKIKTTRLDLIGHVEIYLTKLHGCIEGLICLDFAADGLPLPPIIPPLVFMTDVRAEQALVRADKIVTDLNLT